MLNFKSSWKRTPAAVRKPLILIVGSAVIATGIAMLVLPGPGWAAIFLGFAILATEFVFAAKVRDWLMREAKHLGKKSHMFLKNVWQTFKHKLK